MYYLLLAFRCFFAVLFSHRLPAEAQKLLAAPLPPASPGNQPISEAEVIPRPTPQEVRPAPPVAAPPVAAPPVAAPPIAATTAPTPAPTQAEAPAPAAAAPAADPGSLRQHGAIQLLGILQREGRLVDFLMEDVSDYSDAQIGAAVRDIHRGCRKGLREHLQITPVRPEPDEAAVRIDDYNPARVRLIGAISGKPPFHGTLRHHGWSATSVSLPDLPRSHDPLVITPAEVELGG